MNKTIAFFAFLLFAAVPAARAQLTVTQEPQSVTVPVGATATFTAAVNCPTTLGVNVDKNGAFFAYLPKADEAANGTSTTITYPVPSVTAAMNGTTYAFEFYGCAAETGDIPSTPATLTVATVTTPPAAPANLAATASSSSSISLSWTASAGTGVTYVLYRSVTSGFTPAAGNQVAGGISGTSYTDSGLTASTAYYYVVEAEASGLLSPPSNQTTATTLAPSPPGQDMLIAWGSVTLLNIDVTAFEAALPAAGTLGTEMLCNQKSASECVTLPSGQATLDLYVNGKPVGTVTVNIAPVTVSTGATPQ